MAPGAQLRLWRGAENTSSGHMGIMPIAGSAALASAVGLEYEHAGVQVEQ